MARFYRTAGANPLDYMYRMNTPLMERVIQTNDQYITQHLDTTAKLGQLASYNHLVGDEEDAKKITEAYMKEVDAISDAIRKDPANWRRQADPIRNLGRKLQDDYTTGAIGKQIANFNKRKADFDALDKQVELYHTSGGTKGVSPQRAALAKQHWDSKFTKTGYDPTNPSKYNLYSGGTLMDDINIRKRLSEEFDKLKADGIIKTRKGLTGTEEYFNEQTQKWEGLRPEKILGLVTDRLAGDDQLIDYLRQDTEIGNMRGVFDEQGRMIQPYSYNKVGISPEEQANIDSIKDKINKTKDSATKKHLQEQLDAYINQLDSRTALEWNNESSLAPILRGIVRQYSWDKTEESEKLSNNSLYNTKYVQAQTNARDAANRASREEIAKMREDGINKRFKDRLDFDKFKFENPQAKPGTTKATAGAGGGKGTTPVETTVSALATNSFEDWTTKDLNGKEVPVLSNAGLSGDIESFKNQISTIDKSLEAVNKKLAVKPKANDPDTVKNAYNQALLEKQKLTLQRKKLDSDLNQRRTWYQQSLEATLNNKVSGVTVSSNDVALYKEFDNDRDAAKLKKRIAELNYQLTHDAIGQKIPVSAKTALKPFTSTKRLPGETDAAYNTRMAAQDKKVKDHQAKWESVEKELKAAQQKLNSYLSVKSRVDKGRDAFLSSIRKDVIDNDAISLNDKDSDDAVNLILSNTQGLRLFDNEGKNTSSITVDGKGLSWGLPGSDDYNLTFADNSLVDYMNNSGTKMKVVRFAPTTKIGSGNAVVEVRFEDPTGEIPANRSYYVELNPHLQKDLATKFKDNKNVGVAKIAESILDDEANEIRRQIIQPSVNQSLGQSGYEPGSFTIFVTSTDGRKIPLKVTKFNEGGANHLNVTMEDKDGNTVPFPSTNGIPGFFNGVEDFITQFKAAKNAR